MHIHNKKWRTIGERTSNTTKEQLEDIIHERLRNEDDIFFTCARMIDEILDLLLDSHGGAIVDEDYETIAPHIRNVIYILEDWSDKNNRYS
jgi:hypothetical protein|tara:strand:+ start:232 stop:504 length:273 start_codon:yes stop_codon:yes gene_type:complete